MNETFSRPIPSESGSGTASKERPASRVVLLLPDVGLSGREIRAEMRGGISSDPYGELDDTSVRRR